MEEAEYHVGRQAIVDKYNKKTLKLNTITSWGIGLGLLTLVGSIGGFAVQHKSFNPHRNISEVVEYKKLGETLIKLELRGERKNNNREFLNLPYQPEDISPEVKDLFYNPESSFKRDSLEELIKAVRIDKEEMLQKPEVVKFEEWKERILKFYGIPGIGGFFSMLLFGCIRLRTFPFNAFNYMRENQEVEALTKLYSKSKEKKPDVKV